MLEEPELEAAVAAEEANGLQGEGDEETGQDGDDVSSTPRRGWVRRSIASSGTHHSTELIEVQVPDYPIITVDCSIQVSFLPVSCFSTPIGNNDYFELSFKVYPTYMMFNYILAVQVCEEDIVRALADTPCQSEVMSVETSDDHPLRVLSEENLTCASTFTGMNNIF